MEFIHQIILDCHRGTVSDCDLTQHTKAAVAGHTFKLSLQPTLTLLELPGTKSCQPQFQAFTVDRHFSPYMDHSFHMSRLYHLLLGLSLSSMRPFSRS